MTILTAVGLLVAGAVIAELVRRVPRWRAARCPLFVHVETDPTAIWIGHPPWIGASFLLPPDRDMMELSPPSNCLEWRRWARALGGVDEGQTDILVTLSAKEDLTVVVSGLRAVVSSRRAAPAWHHVSCAVGGAAIVPRRVELHFDEFPETANCWYGPGDCEPIDPPVFSISGSEAEVLHIRGVSGRDWVEWTADLLLVVNGRRVTVPIREGRRPFVTSGASGVVESHIWQGNQWVPEDS
jgi:hypothetical protein